MKLCTFCLQLDTSSTPWCPSNPGAGCTYGLLPAGHGVGYGLVEEVDWTSRGPQGRLRNEPVVAAVRFLRGNA